MSDTQDAYAKGYRDGTGITIAEITQRWGFTRRQIEYLIEKGGIRPGGGGKCGVQRRFNTHEQAVLDRLARLIGAGWTMEKARPIARQLVDQETETVDLPGGVTVTLPAQAKELETL